MSEVPLYSEDRFQVALSPKSCTLMDCWNARIDQASGPFATRNNTCVTRNNTCVKPAAARNDTCVTRNDPCVTSNYTCVRPEAAWETTCVTGVPRS